MRQDAVVGVSQDFKPNVTKPKSYSWLNTIFTIISSPVDMTVTA
jgi:hypothetical protein